MHLITAFSFINFPVSAPALTPPLIKTRASLAKCTLESISSLFLSKQQTKHSEVCKRKLKKRSEQCNWSGLKLLTKKLPLTSCYSRCWVVLRHESRGVFSFCFVYLVRSGQKWIDFQRELCFRGVQPEIDDQILRVQWRWLDFIARVHQEHVHLSGWTAERHEVGIQA